LDLVTALKGSPLIAAFRSIENIRWPELDQVRVVFILGGTIFDLPGIAEEAKGSHKMLFVDIDLLKGIGKDGAGVRFLAKESHVDGVITTRGNLIKSIQKEGLVAVQRLFVLDSESLVGGLGVIEKCAPDAVEILPGLILPKIMQRIKMATSVPVIAGGLITEENEVRQILDSGALGVSTTSHQLFSMPSRRTVVRAANPK
jgi:glycerol uptake operon antiterminator